MAISCLHGHPRKFICEKLQDYQTSKILYLENFPIYGMKHNNNYYAVATILNSRTQICLYTCLSLRMHALTFITLACAVILTCKAMVSCLGITSDSLPSKYLSFTANSNSLHSSLRGPPQSSASSPKNTTCLCTYNKQYYTRIKNSRETERVSQTDYRILKHTATSSNLTPQIVNRSQLHFLCAYTIKAPNSLINYYSTIYFQGIINQLSD